MQIPGLLLVFWVRTAVRGRHRQLQLATATATATATVVLVRLPANSGSSFCLSWRAVRYYEGSEDYYTHVCAGGLDFHVEEGLECGPNCTRRGE